MNCNSINVDELIPRGNDFYLQVNLYKQIDSATTVPFDLTVCDEFDAVLIRPQSSKAVAHSIGIVSGTTNSIILDAKNLTNGEYIVEASGKLNGRSWRCAERGIVGVTEFNADSDVTWTLIEGENSNVIDMTFQLIQQTAVIGKNAYELAKEQGYVGSLQDFIEEMVDAGESAAAARAATESAITATNATIAATVSAITTTNATIVATNSAITATQNANAATQNAIKATNSANTATQNAIAATENANTATTAARAATESAITATNATIAATNSATTATQNTITATNAANVATNSAITAAVSASTATVLIESNEATRQSNEETRQENELTRQTNEEHRETVMNGYNDRLTNVETNKADYSAITAYYYQKSETSGKSELSEAFTFVTTDLNNISGRVEVVESGEIDHYVNNPSGVIGSKYTRTQWSGDVENVTSLYTGLKVMYKIPVAGVTAGVTLNINNLGEHPVVLNANTPITTQYPVKSILQLTYDEDQTVSLKVNNVTTSFVGCWKIPNYDSNTTYKVGTTDVLSAGTETTGKLWSAKILNEYVADEISNFSSGLSTVATSGDYTDLTNKPTNISEFTNDSGYITSTTSGLTIAVVDVMPDSPNNDTIYIVR